MIKQTSQQMAASRARGTVGKGSKFAAASAAVIVMMLLAAGSATAGTASSNTGAQTPNVNVVNTPTVNVGNTPNVNIANTPAVSISGTPTVNANVQFPATQEVMITPGSATNVGRLPSQHVQLAYASSCPSTMSLVSEAGDVTCFDMAKYPGQILIITDYSWDAFGNGAANTTCSVGIVLNNNLVGLSSAVMDSDNRAVKSEHLTAGIKTIVNPKMGVLLDQGPCLGFNFATMQGYLIQNQ